MTQQSPAQDELEFELLAEIALGGSARVELSRVTKGPRGGDLVAVKRLLPHVADDPQFVDMFRDEVWMTSALRHPHVVEVVGWGQDGEGPWLAVELVRGVSLQRLMKTVFETGERFTERMVVYTARCICDGLAAAHSLQSASGEHLNVVHRDLTPGNILLGFDGQVKVADFGLAKAKQRVTKTLTGFLKGKPLYMSPEQVQGWPLDGRSDLFALGVMLFELFSGRRPWRASTDLDAMRAITDEPAEDLMQLAPRMDKALAQVVHKCLEKAPDARYQTALELRDRFNEWLVAHGYRDGNAQSVARFVRRNAMRQMRWFERAARGDLAAKARADHQARARPRLSVAPPPPQPPPADRSAGQARPDETGQTRHDKPASMSEPAPVPAQGRPPQDSWPEDDEGPTLIKRSEAAREAIRRSLNKPRAPKRKTAPSVDPVTQRQNQRNATDELPTIPSEAPTTSVPAARVNQVGVLAPPDPSVPLPPVAPSEVPPPTTNRVATPVPGSNRASVPPPAPTRASVPPPAPQRTSVPPPAAGKRAEAPSSHRATAETIPNTRPKPRSQPLSDTITRVNQEAKMKAVPVPRFPSFTGSKPNTGADPASQAERLGKAAAAAADNAQLAARIAQAAARAALLAAEASRARTQGDGGRSLKLMSEALAIDNALKNGEVPEVPEFQIQAKTLVSPARDPALSPSPIPPSPQAPVREAPVRVVVPPSGTINQLTALLRTREGILLVGAILFGMLLTVVLLVTLLK